MFTIYSIGDSAFLAQILNALAMICGTGDFKTLVGVGALLGLLVMGFQCLTIYSIGDSAFLAQILNALAMICGTGDFKTLVGVGALLGLLVMGFQCLTSGTRQFNLHQVLIGMICYMCFFGPGVTVQVEDAYTDEVRVVDNVPLGAAAAGTIISNIGYGVTALFEQGYGTADRMTEHAFLEPLKVLTGVRSAARDVSIIEAAGKAIGNADLAQDIDNYLRECTMVKITLGQATPDAIYRGGTNELFYDSSVYGTRQLPARVHDGEDHPRTSYAGRHLSWRHQ